jgi:hypothetical protein
MAANACLGSGSVDLEAGQPAVAVNLDGRWPAPSRRPFTSVDNGCTTLVLAASATLDHTPQRAEQTISSYRLLKTELGRSRWIGAMMPFGHCSH